MRLDGYVITRNGRALTRLAPDLIAALRAANGLGTLSRGRGREDAVAACRRVGPLSRAKRVGEGGGEGPCYVSAPTSKLTSRRIGRRAS